METLLFHLRKHANSVAQMCTSQKLASSQVVPCTDGTSVKRRSFMVLTSPTPRYNALCLRRFSLVTNQVRPSGSNSRRKSRLDILIDGGGHQSFQQIATMEAVLPHLAPGDILQPKTCTETMPWVSSTQFRGSCVDLAA